MRVLELFSGIGGMHLALKESQIPFEIIAAADINTVANEVYKFNFPEHEVLPKNIQSFNEDFINRLEIEMITMSPPCQPFTRLGKKQDISDKRSDALSHIINLIPHLKNSLKYILLENVKGFECSEARIKLISSLTDTGFDYREFLLNPLQFGVANSRERYYLIAKRNKTSFQNYLEPKILITDIPEVTNSRESIKMKMEDIIEFSDDSSDYEEYLLPLNILEKRIWILDIVTKESNSSCCFTKSYSHYMEGTGSVYCPFNQQKVDDMYKQLKEMDKASSDYLRLLEHLRLRFFTPTEVKRLLSFPNYFSFPKCTTNKQKYRLLGNSVNVKVVKVLIKLLIENANCNK